MGFLDKYDKLILQLISKRTDKRFFICYSKYQSTTESYSNYNILVLARLRHQKQIQMFWGI